MVSARSCPAGQFITNINADGELVCSPIDVLTKNAFDDHCRIHLGWRDQCSGCTDPPAKWGSVSAKSCDKGFGVDNTCEIVNLGGTSVQLFGLNLDGNVDTNDKLYARFSCEATTLVPSSGPCDLDELVIDYSSGMLGCGAASVGILDALRSSCRMTLGARDSCDGCNAPPLQWGQTSTLQCSNGSAGQTTCSMATLGAETVDLLGLDFEGDVDGNDTLFIGSSCTAPTTMPAKNVAKCPAGQYATGITADGNIDCAPVDALAIAYFEAHCRFYLGTSDYCNGCLGVPDKWGYTTASLCQNGVGLDSSCFQSMFGTEMVRLFGLNFDGDVGADDAIYVGLHCE